MFWDNVAGVYDIFVHLINRKTHQTLREIVGRLISPEDEVLECACGTGMLTQVIAPRCSAVIATDFSSKMLQRAQKNCLSFANAAFLQADITALPFPDGRFDKVVAGNVIHLLSNPRQALREMERVCRPGGMLILPTYMNKTAGGDTGALAASLQHAGADFKRQFTPDSYRRFFEENGYRDVRIQLAEGRIPCAVAILANKAEGR